MIASAPQSTRNTHAVPNKQNVACENKRENRVRKFLRLLRILSVICQGFMKFPMPTTAAYRLLVKARANREISEILPATSLLFIDTVRVSVTQTDFSQVLYVGIQGEGLALPLAWSNSGEAPDSDLIGQCKYRE